MRSVPMPSELVRAHPTETSALHRRARFADGLGHVAVVCADGSPARSRALVEAAGGRTVLATPSVTAALRAASHPAAVDTVLIQLPPLARFLDEWAGHRLIGRVVERTAANVVVWVEADDADGAAFSLGAGAHAVVRAGEVETDHAPQVAAQLLAGETTPAPAPQAEQSIADWFEARHDAPWRGWTEQAAVAMASSSDRATQAEVCAAAWSCTREAANRRLREVRELLCDEVREQSALERRMALELLGIVARHRAIAPEPITARSLTRAARAVRGGRRSIDLSGVNEIAIANLLAIASAESALLQRTPRGPGRPDAGAWRTTRRHAIGRVAAQRATTAAAKIRLHDDLAVELEHTLLAVHDALDDASRAGHGDGARGPLPSEGDRP